MVVLFCPCECLWKVSVEFCSSMWVSVKGQCWVLLQHVHQAVLLSHVLYLCQFVFLLQLVSTTFTFVTMVTWAFLVWSFRNYIQTEDKEPLTFFDDRTLPLLPESLGGASGGGDEVDGPASVRSPSKPAMWVTVHACGSSSRSIQAGKTEQVVCMHKHTWDHIQSTNLLSVLLRTGEMQVSVFAIIKFAVPGKWLTFILLKHSVHPQWPLRTYFLVLQIVTGCCNWIYFILLHMLLKENIIYLTWSTISSN